MRRDTNSPKLLMLKALLKFSFYSLIVLFLFVITLEILLRTTHLFGARISWAKPDSVLGWRNVPGAKYWHNLENDHPISGHINSFGWRDDEWVLAKPINTYRIAVLGDSYVEALQVESQKTFISLTEKGLNRINDRKVELMNFGRAGFSQTEEFLLLRNEVLQFSPDLVILFFLPENDIRDISKETAPNKLRPFYSVSHDGELSLDTSFKNELAFKLKSFINPIKLKSATISLLSERYNSYIMQRERVKMKKRMGRNGHHRIEGALSLATANPDTRYVKNFELNKILIKKMSELCKKKGIRFMLVTLDTTSYQPEIEKHYLAMDPTFNSNYFNDDLSDFAISLDIEYVGLQELFRERYKITGSPLHWDHWNYKGHEVVANALISRLVKFIYTPTQ